ncbi:MAG: ABC transporter permease [Dehalococcoidia bacterium]
MNALKDTWYISLRDIRTRLRMPVFLFMSMAQPILFLLLFPEIFKSVGSAMFAGGTSYLQFFTPAVLVMTGLFSAVFSGMGTIMDIDTGILSRMSATPVTRVSIILGRVIATVVVLLVQAAIILIIGVIMGVDIATGAGGALLALLLIALLGLGISAFSNGVALLVKRQETLMATTNLLTLPLMFLSTMMMPEELLPGWLQTVTNFNPVDYTIVGVRSLFLEGYNWSDLWPSFAVLGGIAVVMVIFATMMVRRRVE